MNKKEWKDLHSILSKIRDDFYDAYSARESGRNKVIKAKGSRDVDNLIARAKSHIIKYEESSKVISEDERDYVYQSDEFFQPRYFSNSLKDYLSKIEEKINSVDS